MNTQHPGDILFALISEWEKSRGGEKLTENELSRRTKVPQPTIHRILKKESNDPRRSPLAPEPATVRQINTYSYCSDQCVYVLSLPSPHTTEITR